LQEIETLVFDHGEQFLMQFSLACYKSIVHPARAEGALEWGEFLALDAIGIYIVR